MLAQREARAASCGHTQPHTRRLIHHEAVKRDPKVSLSLTCVPSVVPKPTWKLTLVTAARPCRPCKTVVTQVCEGHRPPALAPRLCLQLVAPQSRCLCGTGRSALRLSGTQPAPLSSPELHLLPSSKRMGEGPPLSSLQGLALSTSTLRCCPPGLLPPASLSHSPPSSTQGKKLPAFVSGFGGDCQPSELAGSLKHRRRVGPAFRGGDGGSLPFLPLQVIAHSLFILGTKQRGLFFLQ